MALGVLIENKDPKEVLEEIKNGLYKDEITNQKTLVSPEKKAKIDDFFKEIDKAQQEAKKKEEEEKAAAEQAKAQEATAKPSEEAKPEKEEPKEEVKKK